MFFTIAIIFYVGTLFIRDIRSVTTTDIFTAIYAITFSAMTVGNNSHFLPDVGAGKAAAANLFQILDSEDEDQLQIKEESKLLKKGFDGHIKFEEVDFKY